MPTNLAWFNGHFPGDPILPAVIQIDWAMHFAALAGDRLDIQRERFAGMSRLKFRAVIVPGTILKLNLEKSDDLLKFSLVSRSGEHARGNIRFHADTNNG